VEAGRDDVPVLVGRLRHQLEHLADALHRREQRAEVAQALARVVQRERRLEPLAQQARAPALGGVERLDAAAGRDGVRQLRERGALQVRDLLRTGRREVGQPVAALGQAERGGHDRVQPDGAVDVAVGDPPRRRRALIGGRDGLLGLLVWHGRHPAVDRRPLR
jgi:hypothetical protein